MLDDNNTFCVYRHIFPNGKLYIGITSQPPKSRWGSFGGGYRNQRLIWRAIQKYGWDNIEHEILYDGLSEDEAKSKEQELVALYMSNNKNFGYNSTSGGDVGTKLSEEQKLQHSKRMSSKNHPNYGKHLSEETRRKIGDANRGRVYTPEQRKRMSDAHKGKELSEGFKEAWGKYRGGLNGMSKKVCQIDFDTGDLIRVFDCIADAARATGKSTCSSGIVAVCKGKRNKANGYKWVYYSDWIKNQ